MTGLSRDPLILFYTRAFDRPVDVAAIACNLPGEWTNDRRRIAEAAAVVFHIPNFREFGDARKYPGQLWVAWSAESSGNYPVMREPGFMAHFDLRMTYESDAEIWAPYVPRRPWWMETRTRPVPAKTAPAPVAMFQSSNVNLSGRDRFMRELSQEIEVHSYGRFMNNRTLDGPDRGRETKLETIGRYPFCIAFENSICADYVTEKLYDPLAAGTVPIYLGAPNVADFAPRHSYVDAADFSGPRDLAAYLRHLLATPDEYAGYFEWRSKPLETRFEARLDRIAELPFCRLLATVRERLASREAAFGPPTFEFGLSTFVRARLRRWRKGLS